MNTQEKSTCRAEEILAEIEAELGQSEVAAERFDEALSRLLDRDGLTSSQQQVLGGLAKCLRKCRKRSRKIRRRASRLRAGS